MVALPSIKETEMTSHQRLPTKQARSLRGLSRTLAQASDL
jgi:hypothetical protein